MVAEPVGASHDGQRHGNLPGEPEYAVQTLGRGQLAHRAHAQGVVRQGLRGLTLEESGMVDRKKERRIRLGEIRAQVAQDGFSQHAEAQVPVEARPAERPAENPREPARCPPPRAAPGEQLQFAVADDQHATVQKAVQQIEQRERQRVIVVENHEFAGPGAHEPPAAPQGGGRIAAHPASRALAPHDPDTAECDARHVCGVSVTFEQPFETPALRGVAMVLRTAEQPQAHNQQSSVEHLVERIPGNGIYDADLHGRSQRYEKYPVPGAKTAIEKRRGCSPAFFRISWRT